MEQIDLDDIINRKGQVSEGNHLYSPLVKGSRAYDAAIQCLKELQSIYEKKV